MKKPYKMDPNYLQNYMRNVFGESYTIGNIIELHGGAQKTVYKIDCINGFSCVLYIWDLVDNFFQKEKLGEESDERSFGSDLFYLNNKYLSEKGINTPFLYDLKTDRNIYSFDYGLIQYIEGHKLESFLKNYEVTAERKLMQRVGDLITCMHSEKRNEFGCLESKAINNGKCHLLQLKKAIKDLSYTSQYDTSIQYNHDKILSILNELESKIKLRNEYRFIHWELGPDHILVNAEKEPFIIDIEGAKFFDVEYEHAFLKLRFGNFYRYFEDKDYDLDPDRMCFYQFYHHISLTSGGLKLLNRGFPNQKFAKELARYHTDCVLNLIKCYSQR
ncbi:MULTISPECIES: phosphotransferase [Bacillaceae]